MKDVQDLHQSLYLAIDKKRTDESLTVIDSLCEVSDRDRVNHLERYSHSCSSLTPLLHSIARENSVVALYLLEKGCKPSMDYKFKSFTPSCLKFKHVFKIIGKGNFEKVFMKIIEATKDLILDDAGNTVLHIICQKKLTSWLKMVLNFSSCKGLLSQYNNCGYLPMHVAAQSNFVEFFQLVFHDSPNQSDHFLLKSEIFDGEDHSSKKRDGELCKKTNSFFTENSGSSGECCEMKFPSTSVTEGRKPEDEKLCSNGNNVCTSPSNFKYDKIDINKPVKRTTITVLHLAAHKKFKGLVRLLLELRVSVNGLQKRNSCSPLFYCFSLFTPDIDFPLDSSFVDICSLLIDAGANVNELNSSHAFVKDNRSTLTEERDIVTLLHLAARIGCKEVVQILLEKGADPSILSKIKGKLPLQVALEEGHRECAEILLEKNLYPEKFLSAFMDKERNNLMHAACNLEEEIILKLLKLGCPFDKPNVNNVYPLDKAIHHGNALFIHSVLCQHPEMINLSKHVKVCPPLHLAAKSDLRSAPLCQILLSYGANIYAKAYGKNMAYQAALRNSCYHNAVYLCQQMSRPFTLSERKELLEYAERETCMSRDLASSIIYRIENVPSLFSHCLDVIRQVFIQDKESFKTLESLPLPVKMIRALKYLDADQCVEIKL